MKRRSFLENSAYTISMTALAPLLPQGSFNQRRDLPTMNEINLLGSYGNWATNLVDEDSPALFSFRQDAYNDLRTWKSLARKIASDRLAAPDLLGLPKVTVERQYEYDNLVIEELSWSLPYGPPTNALFMKPKNVEGPLPGILALHDHGANKYFGLRKITKSANDQHPLMETHQNQYYEGKAWANEIAKRGYAVLIADAFLFASRRILLSDVPSVIRKGLTDEDPEDPENIQAYNDWAAEHEHIVAKSLFSAGTTWPGAYLVEDQMALTVLASRNDVDEDNLGCGGLSGGGLRTVMLGGMDDRIKCAICVGYMTTWRDMVLYKSYTHTWMGFVPHLPRELDFPELFGLRVPLPIMVLNNEADGLFTLGEMKRADRILQEVFDKADAGDQYRCSFHPGDHKFDLAMQNEAFDWFDRWLRT
ncbi:MAG: prolyl oligopeptidase family serine peptidase [Saprospiraceae bacterium]|nr:prolyl oligopeptidase family serine peptidase [Saprospiraceae bacterium]